MKRVIIKKGDFPALIVSPYVNTHFNKILQQVADNLKCSRVINNGWEQSSQVDFFNDLADCNNIEHIHADVVKDEFLDPIIEFSDRSMQSYGFNNVYVFHEINLKKNIDVIVGYGAGRIPSHTCPTWLKDAFIYFAEKQGYLVYGGRANGEHAGRSKSELNQLFRKWYFERNINSFQIKVNSQTLLDEKSTSRVLSYVIDKITGIDRFDEDVHGKEI